MSEPDRRMGRMAFWLILGLLQTTPVLARGDHFIQKEIEARFSAEEKLRGTGIEVQVEAQLVVLTGQVRLYEQKLIGGRIAWTTPGVVEVDNEIRVLPKLPVSDAAIERKIREIVKSDDRFREAKLEVRVNKGEVKLTGSFIGFSDPTILKHKVAEIEGVVDIKISAAFFAWSSAKILYVKEHFRELFHGDGLMSAQAIESTALVH
jgi:osmotically-inducible protein OsmY